VPYRRPLLPLRTRLSGYAPFTSSAKEYNTVSTAALWIATSPSAPGSDWDQHSGNRSPNKLNSISETMNLNVIFDPPARKPSVAVTLALNRAQNAINSAQRASAFSEISQVEGLSHPALRK
jgi:hypothetical protein